MSALCVTRCLSVLGLTLFSSTASSTWACIALLTVSLITSITRHPVILLTSIWNFGPLRNTVGLYVENLPDHLHSSITEPLYQWLENLKRAFAHRDDQRSIVVYGDDSDSSASDDGNNPHRRGT